MTADEFARCVTDCLEQHLERWLEPRDESFYRYPNSDEVKGVDYELRPDGSAEIRITLARDRGYPQAMDYYRRRVEPDFVIAIETTPGPRHDA